MNFVSFLLIIFSLQTTHILGQNCGCTTSKSSSPNSDLSQVDAQNCNKRLIPYAYIREADGVWSKKVWSYIDLREKMNLPLYYPLTDQFATDGSLLECGVASLWSIIKCNVLSGAVTAFSPFSDSAIFSEWDGDQFKYPIQSETGKNFCTDEQFRERILPYFATLGKQSDIPLVDEYGEPKLIRSSDGFNEFVYAQRDTLWYEARDIVQYRIKEEWFFDKERGELDVRILGIAPVIHLFTEQPDGLTVISGSRELFWIYFPQFRPVLNRFTTLNDKNESQRLTFDDLFMKRQFGAVIYKMSNLQDQSIDAYATGTQALWESVRIKEYIRNLESDIWVDP